MIMSALYLICVVIILTQKYESRCLASYINKWRKYGFKRVCEC